MNALCKCVIWDLDDTLWDGICLEGHVTPRPDTIRAIETLGARGIVHAVASRGDEEIATRTLARFGLERLFVTTRINWLPKSTNIRDIAETLHLPFDAIAFVDDDAFERAQVAFMLPDVRIYEAEAAPLLPIEEGFDPGVVTAEGEARARLYRDEARRQEAAGAYASREDFLRACDMRLTVRPALTADIRRVGELMRRTHQMNSTGLLPRDDELASLAGENDSDGNILFVAELEDRFGWCGIIATILVATRPGEAELRLFAMSCRVMGRGIERAILSALVDRMAEAGATRVLARYTPTDRNRMIRTMFQLAGFRPVAADETPGILFELDFQYRPTCPSWVSMS